MKKFKLLYVIVAILCILLSGCGYESSDEYKEEIRTGTISDIYIDKSDPNIKEYYMDVYIPPDTYAVKISKHDFMKYKVGEYAHLKFKGNRVRSIVK